MTSPMQQYLRPPGFLYLADFLSLAEQETTLAQVKALEFGSETFRGRPMKRRWAQFGHAYRATAGRVEEAPPFPAFLTILAGRVQSLCPPGTPPFNQSIITEYPEGAGIGWHTDAPIFGQVIAGVSLGEAGVLHLRLPPGAGRHAATSALEQPLALGSLFLLSGKARSDYQHRIKAVKGARYSITLHHVAPRG